MSVKVIRMKSVKLINWVFKFGVIFIIMLIIVVKNI